MGGRSPPAHERQPHRAHWEILAGQLDPGLATAVGCKEQGLNCLKGAPCSERSHGACDGHVLITNEDTNLSPEPAVSRFMRFVIHIHSLGRRAQGNGRGSSV